MSGIQKKTATVLVQPSHSAKQDDRIMFEISKNDVDSILDKIESVLW